MTSYQLRKHLAGAHDLPLRGLAHEQLVMIHDRDHLKVPGHDHEHTHDGEGDG
jgi:hypothetical protein